MPEGRPFMPRIRMPKVTRRGRTSRAANEETTATRPKQSEKAGNGTQRATKEEAQPAAATPVAGNPAAGATTPEPNLQERMEGLQGWMADLERKQARLTYFGGLALLLALGAAGAALYFGLTAHNDSAKKGDLGALTNRVNSLQSAVSKNSKDTQNALNASIAQLQQSISGLQKQQSTAQQTLSTLQSQVNAAQLNSKNAAPLAPTTPPTTTTPGGANGK